MLEPEVHAFKEAEQELTKALEEKSSVAVEQEDAKAEADNQGEDVLSGVEAGEAQDALLAATLVSKH